MEHEMKLQSKYYDFILKGTKRIEIRLFDEKRRKIKLGNTIKFLRAPLLNEVFKARVVELLRYDSFEDMISDFDINVLADESMTKEELISTFEGFIQKKNKKIWSFRY